MFSGLRRALLHVQGRKAGAGAAGGARARGKALPPIQEWRRFDAWALAGGHELAPRPAGPCTEQAARPR